MENKFGIDTDFQADTGLIPDRHRFNRLKRKAPTIIFY